MTNKKIITFAVIASILLIGGGWYYSKQAPSASIYSSLPAGSSVISEEGIMIGNPDAPVTIEEYTSFLCTACARFTTITLEQIKEDYVKTGKVKMVFYVYPPYELGWAALCSQEQNKFVEFHDYVFAHQAQITEESAIKDMALNAGLDSEKFNACYASDKYAAKVTKWYEEGEARGVEATPTFFINGQKLVGAQPYSDFKKIIEEKLDEAR